LYDGIITVEEYCYALLKKYRAKLLVGELHNIEELPFSDYRWRITA
jgi:hypothetical protein